MFCCVCCACVVFCVWLAGSVFWSVVLTQHLCHDTKMSTTIKGDIHGAPASPRSVNTDTSSPHEHEHVLDTQDDMTLMSAICSAWAAMHSLFSFAAPPAPAVVCAGAAAPRWPLIHPQPPPAPSRWLCEHDEHQQSSQRHAFALHPAPVPFSMVG